MCYTCFMSNYFIYRYNNIHVILTDVSETIWPQGLPDDVQKKYVLVHVYYDFRILLDCN